jgi:hypothetical protein
MTLRRSSAALAVLAALLLSACTSSGSKGAAKTTGGATSAPASGTTTDPAALSRIVKPAVTALSSAHLVVTVDAAGQKLAGSGDETLDQGRLQGLRMTVTLPGAGDVQLLVAGGKNYAKLPGALNPSGKPYVLITPTSTNPTVKTLAPLLGIALSSASVGSYGDFVAAADSVTSRGPASVGGVRTTHYSVVVNVSKLPASLPGRAALVQNGVKTVPLELYLDDRGRPARVDESVSVQGAPLATQFLISRYNAPVSIAAPPASQVSS